MSVECCKRQQIMYYGDVKHLAWGKGSHPRLLDPDLTKTLARQI